MPDKKQTDSLSNNEIIKALECCADEMGCTKGCPCLDGKKGCKVSNEGLSKYALDLINRLQEENERLQKEVAKEFTCFVGDPHKVEHCPYLEELQTARTKAYKEFAERLHEELRMYGIKDKFDKAVFLNVVDKAKKELGGEDK